jgi:amidase
MNISELCFASITDIAPLLESKAISPVELCRAMLERIGDIDVKLGSYVHVASEKAMSQARAAENEIISGRYRGSLHGIPLGIKDIFFTTDMPTVCGSPQLIGWTPPHDAHVVDRLREAGATLLGKQATAEFAFTGYHPTFKAPINPWKANRWSGVSSGGSSVAVAASLCFGSFGTDTGGSIRYPSAANGIVGMKPTFGRVSRRGVYPFAETLDHVGPLARSVTDAAVLLQAVAGPDPDDQFCLKSPMHDVLGDIKKDIKGVKVGYDLNYWKKFAQPDVVETTLLSLHKLENAGAEIVPIDMIGITEVCEHWVLVGGVEALLHHGREKFAACPDAYGPDVRRLLQAGVCASPDELARAAIARRRVNSLLDDLFDTVDFLILPGMASGSPTTDVLPAQLDLPPEAVASMLAFSAPFNFSGHPTLSLPNALDADGMPLAVQLVGRPLSEAALLRVGYTLEQVTSPIGHPGI